MATAVRNAVSTAVALLGASLLALGAAGHANAQAAAAPSFQFIPGGQVQIQGSTTSVDADDVAAAPAATAFETRRVRLGAGFAYGDWIIGEVEADFAGGSARLTNGFAELALDERVRVRAGQFKKPFGVFELESSTRIRTIERGVRIRGLADVVGVPAETQHLLAGGGYLGRDIGVMAHGSLGRVGYAAGVFSGEGANIRESLGTKAFAGRLTWAIRSPLVLGGAVSVQPTGIPDGAEAGAEQGHGTAVELDASWGGFRQPGLHARAEWMLGDNPLVPGDNPLVRYDVPTMTGIQGLVSWFAPQDGRVEGWEPVLRLSWADPATDIDGDAGVLLTPGLNVYFNGRNRFMVNGDVYVPERDDLDPEFAFVAQLQVHF